MEIRAERGFPGWSPISRSATNGVGVETGAHLILRGSYIQRVAQSVAEEVEREERQGEDAAGEDEQPPELLHLLRAVLDELQGQRVAGVVVFTDGRDTPAQPLAGMLSELADSGIKIYPVLVGSDKMPTNVAIQSVTAQDSAFKGDLVNVRVSVRGSGFESGQNITVQLKDKRSGQAKVCQVPIDHREIQENVAVVVLQPRITVLEGALQGAAGRAVPPGRKIVEKEASVSEHRLALKPRRRQ